MLQEITTKTVGNPTYYTDLSDHKRIVKHSVLLTNEERKELEKNIAEELYRIFTHKAG